MKIYLDCSPLTSGHISGIGVYNKNLFLGLKSILGNQVFPVLKWNRFNKKNIVQKHIDNDVFLLPPIISNKEILYHGTDHKINTFTLGPKIVTIHDMQPFVDQWLEPAFAKKRRAVISKVLNGDIQRIVAVSHFTKQEIVRFFPNLHDKIDVIYHGCDFQVPSLSNQDSYLKNLIQGRPFLLFIGNIEARKNLVNQIKAFEILKRTHTELIFILAGTPGFQFQQIVDYISNSEYKNSIYLLGYLNEADKCYGLENTNCLMFASWYEGFGIPVIEALSLNSSVLISHSSSLVEIAGNYCHQCNPADPNDIAQKVNLIISSGNLKKINVKEWKTQWSWSKCANETINSYKKIYN